MLILSPRAVARLESHKPAWPLPKIFRMTKGGKLNEGIFEGETINTPSMLCVEDYLDTLNWAKSIGGLNALVARADANTKAIADWVARTPWVDFLAKVPATRSNTSVCLKVVDPAITALPDDAQAAFAKSLVAAIEKEGAGYDLGHYRDAPPGLRVWCGATVEASDVEALTQWIDWAFAKTKASLPRRPDGSHSERRLFRSAFPIHIVMAGLTRPSIEADGPRISPGDEPKQSRRGIPMAPRVLISDALSSAAVQIFKDRGIEVDFQPNLGKDKDKLAELVGQFDGLAIRSPPR